MDNENKTPATTVALISPTLEQLEKQLGIIGAKYIKINFKPNKVTASCRHNHFTYGSRGQSLQETLFNLVASVKAGRNVINLKQ